MISKMRTLNEDVSNCHDNMTVRTVRSSLPQYQMTMREPRVADAQAGQDDIFLSCR